MGGFAYEEHTADVMVVASGVDFCDALRQAARACTNLLTPIEYVEPEQERSLLIHADSQEKALFLFLEELVFVLDTAHFVACDASLQFADGVLSGVLRGADISRYERHGDLKAPTKHALSVENSSEGSTVRFVLDI